MRYGLNPYIKPIRFVFKGLTPNGNFWIVPLFYSVSEMYTPTTVFVVSIVTLTSGEIYTFGL